MPELPQMQALSERVEDSLAGATIEGFQVFGFSGLKTATPSTEELVGQSIEGTDRRGKYLIIKLDQARILVHLSQAGRLDIEIPAKKTKPKGSVVRMNFDRGALLIREYGTERKAGWWILRPDDEGPMSRLGLEAMSEEFDEFLRSSDDRRQIHTLLRDQGTIAGIGRGYADDILHRAKLSPFATLKSLPHDKRERLVEAVHDVLQEGIDKERERSGGLSEPKLGEHFTVHRRSQTPCPVCAQTMQRVSFESHEVTYCPNCQTGGKVLADRRLSRLLK